MSGLFGGDNDAPAPDPNIGISARLNAETSKEALDWYKQVYAEDSKPRQAKLDALTEQVTGEQIAISQQNREQAQAQWDRYNSLFAPVEEQMVQDATNIDSEGELNRAAGEAATGVQTQFDNATDQRKRALAATGVNPNSGKALALENEASLGLAASKAGAANNARITAKDKGIALRAGVANLGRGLPNTAATAYNTAVGSGNSAVNNTVAAGNAANASAALMGQGFGTAMQGYQASGNMLQNQYNSQLSAWNAQNQANSNSSAGFGSLVGQLGSAYLMTSSRKAKENKRKIDHNTVLKGLRRTPVEKWNYKEGQGDGGEHISPYAEDMHREFGDTVAPGGKAIDIISTIGINLAATKELDAKVDKMSKAISKISRARGGNDKHRSRGKR